MNGDNMNNGSFGNPSQGTPSQPQSQPQQPQSPPAQTPPQNPGGGMGGQQFTPPPPQEVDVRTMGSDIKSMERGDASPMPDKMTPPQFGAEPNFAPETQFNQDMGGGDATMGAEPAKKQKIWVWVAVVAAIAVLGVGGYFSYPYIFGTPEPIAPEPPVENPIVSPITHQSFFTPVPTVQSTIQLSTITQPAARGSLELVAATPQTSGTLQEVNVQNTNGGQVAFSAYMSVFAPELTVANLDRWFEQDFTTFMFYNENGAWPGYVARLKSGVNIDEVRAGLAALEGATISSFYVTSPGAFDVFKDGQINGLATRYSVGSAAGASFNYGLLGNYLVISTSYPGLQAAVPLLGL